MKRTRLLQRLLGAAGLSLAILGAAILGGSATGVGTAGAQAGPIGALKVLAFGTEATISFTTAEPAIVTVTHKPAVTAAAGALVPAAATADPLTPIVAASGPSGATPFARPVAGEPFQVLRQYTTTHRVKLTGLTSSTAYDVSVVAETQAGRKHTAETRIITAKQRIRVTLREINITDDGDLDIPTPFGDIERAGDPLWVVGLAWSGVGVGGCFPVDCDYGEYQAGHIVPRNSAGQSLTWLFAEENFDKLPNKLELYTYTVEDDGVIGSLGAALSNCFSDGTCDFVVAVNGGYAYDHNHRNDAHWTMPQGVEFSTTTVTVRGNDDITDFRSVLTFTVETFHDHLSYPAPKRNAPSSTWR